MPKLVILIAGGTGFVGRRVAQLLEKRGHRVIISNRQQRAVPTYADVIINLVGIIREDCEQSYEKAHVESTEWLVRLGKKLRIRQFVQMSALGADSSGTPYQRTKAQAERIVMESGLPYTIVRPSIIFGPEDRSINRFRVIARTGVFPVFAHGKVQPVSVETVAELIAAAAEQRTRKRIIEVGGPEVFTLEELADRIHPGVHAVRLPKPLVRTITFFGRWTESLPTEEQVIMLGQGSTTTDRTVERLRIKNPRLI
jgi:NADH dehydrogenase